MWGLVLAPERFSAHERTGARLKSLLKTFSTRKEQLRFLKFCVVGFSGVAVNMGIFAICAEVLFSSMEAGARNILAASCAVAVSILTNFLLNDGWTWRDRRREGLRALATRLTKYYVVAGLAGLVQVGIQYVLSVPVGFNAHLSNFAGISAGVLINFFVNNLWTFRDDAAELEDEPSSKGEPMLERRMGQADGGAAQSSVAAEGL